jgi:ATP-dependent Clp endopeptidase proteolytic subunit ClpP
MAEEQLPREIWVNEFTEKSAQKFREQVINTAAQYGASYTIPIYIDSYGGYVDSLAIMIETMDSVLNRVVTIVSGKAMSCGAILLSHGDYRYCGKYSRVMIHNIHGGTWGDAYDKEQSSKETMRMQKQFMGLLAENCGITYKQLEEKIKASISSKEIWLNAEESVKFGIADFVDSPSFSNIIQVAVDKAPIKVKLTDEQKGKKSTKKKVTKKVTKKKGKTNVRSRK